MHNFLNVGESSKRILEGVSTKLVLAIATYVLLAVLAIILTNSWMNTIKELRQEGIQASNVLVQLASLRADLARAETAQSTYLLTQRPENIGPFKTQISKVRQDLDLLRQSYKRSKKPVNNQDDTEALWLATQSAVEGKITVMQLAVSMLSTGRDDKAVEIINAGDGFEKMRSFYSHTDALMLLESKRRQELLTRSAFYLTMGQVSVAISVLLVLVLLIVLVKKFILEISSTEDSKVRLQIEVDKVEQKLAERTRLLETLARDYQFDVERERHKLSRELHDELGSILTASKMDISWVIRRIRDTVPEAAEKLGKTMRYLDQGIEFKRRVVNDLHPSLLTTFGLLPALRELIDSFAERNGWEMDVSLPESAMLLSEGLGLIAYRIVQETLTNASKYADATKVSISFLIENDYLKLEITDNGKGMDTLLRKADTHGLDGMRHRVVAVGGTFNIESSHGKGMFTRALIPLDIAPEKTAEALLVG